MLKEKFLYVWFDAPIGYISATKELTAEWADYWCKDDTKLVHFIGKDNIVFHCIIFPAMLKAHGGFVLPDNVPANEFLNIEGEKVSTSRNWAVWVHDYIRDFPDQQDVLRYVLCANSPETKDNDFTWKDFQDRNNSELVSIFGNFVNRTFVLMHKLCNGKVPPLHTDVADARDLQMLGEFEATKLKVESLLEQYKFRDALFEVIDLARKGNKFMQEREPWILAKKLAEQPDLQKQIDNCLHICLQLTANLAVLISPFLPFTAKKLLHMMKVVDKMLDWENAGKTKLLSVGYSLRPPELLFRKIDDAEIAAQVEKLKAGLIKPASTTIETEGATGKSKTGSDMDKETTTAKSNSEIANTNSDKANSDKANGDKAKTDIAGKSVTTDKTITADKSVTTDKTITADKSASATQPGNELSSKPEQEAGAAAIKPEIVYDDFGKLDLRVGKIVSASKVEKADKLLKLSVDLGFETRTIVSGIALHFKPEDIVGKQVVVVANLAPRKMRGIESNGMILMAEDKGQLRFINPDEAVEPGSPVS